LAVAATTSTAAFVGWFLRGPVNAATHVASLADFQRIFGGLALQSEASYAILQFFTNGGADAWIVRLNTANAAASQVTLPYKLGDGDSVAAQLDSLAQEEASTAASNASQAWTAASQAYQDLYSTTAGAFSPPQSPPTSPPFTDDQIASPPAASPPAGSPPGANDAAALQRAVDATLKAAGFAQQAVDYTLRTANSVTALIGMEDPNVRAAAWRAAESAAMSALDAAAVANKAAASASAAADKVNPASPPDPAGANKALADLQTAAADAAAATQKALSAAEDAQFALNDLASATAAPGLLVQAANPGAWGNCLRVFVTWNPIAAGGSDITFNLRVAEVGRVRGAEVIFNQETFTKLKVKPGDPQDAATVINGDSELITVSYQGQVLTGTPLQATLGDPKKIVLWTKLAGGVDGLAPTGVDLDPAALTDQKRGVPAWTAQLENIAPATVNILCLPDTIDLGDDEATAVFDAARDFAAAAHCIHIYDIPKRRVSSLDKLTALPTYLSNKSVSGETSVSSVAYVPNLLIPDPLNGFRPREVGPSGTMAGVYARTDMSRGVWKAPAGVTAVLMGADVAIKVSDQANGDLNSNGINVLRTFPVYGPISWGARTLAGADLLESEWKYLSVRRLVDFIEQTLYQSLKWVVFEPNDEATWSQIRFEVGSFLSGLLADGAFAGPSPDQAFFVRCDDSTTSSSDIDRGVVNIVVGVAPVKPAEFVVLQIQQIAAQAAA
jgi:hypothetical protein